ncbi:indole-3-glycerol phosphate synthase TrpC [Desulforamulus putei]|uniref:indole-3-glycerol phosphate synthase TrpC n=1 Tax=Desulforamulus putei TaxID=74701 RepID=UPI002FDE1533
MILQRIIESKKQEIEKLKRTSDLRDMARQITKLPPARDFKKAIGLPGSVSLIAEIKKASPSKGVLCPDFDHRRLARIYSENGAAAISVLTDAPFFRGHLAYLEEVRQETELPLLRKDFIMDPLQLYQSRLAGADAVLLIAAVLSDEELTQLLALAEDLGLQALVEVHTQEELMRVLQAGAEIIGINNRNLHTFDTDLVTTSTLMGLINGPGITVVSESGIHNREHIQFLNSLGVHAALVGEALVTARDIGCKVRELAGGGGCIAS